MNNGLKYYKIKIIKQFVIKVGKCRDILLQELIVNATDPVVFKRRIRMLKHLNSYETQIISKIQNFETNNVDDLNSFDFTVGLKTIMNRSS